MDAQRIRFKIHLADPSVNLHAFVPVFHSWIRTRALDEILIDVVDYSHVHDGPGVILICHAANYGIDMSGGRPGLVYGRKRDAPGTWDERLLSAFLATLVACRKLEEEPGLEGKLRFSTDGTVLRINDRLHAPNAAETQAAVEPSLGRLCERVFGKGAFELARSAEPDEPFTMTIHLKGEAPPVASLLQRL